MCTSPTAGGEKAVPTAQGETTKGRSSSEVKGNRFELVKSHKDKHLKGRNVRAVEVAHLRYILFKVGKRILFKSTNKSLLNTLRKKHQPAWNDSARDVSFEIHSTLFKEPPLHQMATKIWWWRLLSFCVEIYKIIICFVWRTLPEYQNQ